MKRRTVLAIWLGLVAVAAVLSLLPFDIPLLQHVPDVVEHGATYFLLALAPVIALRRLKAGVFAAGGMLLMGVLIELIQTQIPGRAFEWADIASNLFGVVSGAASGLALRGVLANRLMN